MPVELVKGALRLSGTPLWFDAKRRSELAFVSHAHTDHIAKHDRVIATKATARIMAFRLGELEAVEELGYGMPVQIGALQIELFPAGHVLGAAQVRVTREDGHRIVYTGDLSTGPALTATQSEVVPCDTLVIESTFGHPKFTFPPRDEVYDSVAAWARQQQEAGVQPIIYAYSLGKSQETVAQLTQRGFSVAVHEQIHDITLLYQELGVPLAARRFDGTFRPGEVGVFPPFGRSQALKHLEQRRSTAVLTGWAVEPWGARRSGADLAFPVSDHADHRSLVDYALATGAREVMTVHGYAEELATALRAKGMFARAATESVQMTLPWR